MPESLGNADYRSLGDRDILQNDFDSLLSILIEDFEFLPKVIEDLPEGSKGVGRDEFNLVEAAVVVDLNLQLMG